MTLRSAGKIRLGEVDDSLVIVLDVSEDVYAISLADIAALTQSRVYAAPVYRRYVGAGGKHFSVRIAPKLRRSRSGRALVLQLSQDEIYTVSVSATLAAVQGIESEATVSQIVTDADQMSDSHSWQTSLGE